MKKRFTVGTMLIVALALVVSNLLGAAGLYLRQAESARQSLRELLTLTDAQAEVTDPAKALSAFQAAAPDKRLTLIAPDGAVLADTGGATANHADRPEVAQALTTGWGEVTRDSATAGCPMLYVAKRFSDGTIGRASMPLSTLDALVLQGLFPLLMAALAALLLAFPFSRRLAGRLVRPLDAVSASLRAVQAGSPPEALSPYAEDPELEPILRQIQDLMERLSEDLRQIKAERDKVNFILDCMSEGLILLDEQDRVLAVNRAARRLFDLPETASPGALVPLRSRRVRQALDQVRRENQPVVLDLEEPEDSRQLRLFLSPVSGRQYEGGQVGTAVLVTDVTALKRAENSRAQFTANVSHELKTPLTSIKGISDMLCSGIVKEESDRRRFLTMIGVESDRLIALINDILELSELESVRIDAPGESACPLEMAQEVEALLAPTAAARSVTLTAQGAADAAQIPPTRLKELLLNLVENGIKYSKETGGQVSVTVERTGDTLTIQVADDGIGIPVEAQSRLFERFYRVDKGRSRQSGGTGLGLAIVKHIAELYNGGVSVTSAPGSGAVFTVTLPAAEKRLPNPEKAV